MNGKTKIILNYLKRNKVIVKDTGVPLVYEVDFRGVAMPSNKFEETVLDFIKEVTVFINEQKEFNQAISKHTQFNRKK